VGSRRTQASRHRGSPPGRAPGSSRSSRDVFAPQASGWVNGRPARTYPTLRRQSGERAEPGPESRLARARNGDSVSTRGRAAPDPGRGPSHDHPSHLGQLGAPAAAGGARVLVPPCPGRPQLRRHRPRTRCRWPSTPAPATATWSSGPSPASCSATGCPCPLARVTSRCGRPAVAAAPWCAWPCHRRPAARCSRCRSTTSWTSSVARTTPSRRYRERARRRRRRAAPAALGPALGPCRHRPGGARCSLGRLC
jgi:hypothetical protein